MPRARTMASLFSAPDQAGGKTLLLSRRSKGVSESVVQLDDFSSMSSFGIVIVWRRGVFGWVWNVDKEGRQDICRIAESLGAITLEEMGGH